MRRIYIFILGATLLAGTMALAASEDSIESKISFPVAELGNCENKSACRAYCNTPDHMEACMDFAQKHGFAAKADIEKAKKFKTVLKAGGPGGCKTAEECKAYCQNPDRIQTCIAFAEQNGLMDKEELEKIKQTRDLLKSNIKRPGDCADEASCHAYCSDISHGEECMNFAVEAGLMPKEKVEVARKMMRSLSSGSGPGGCKTPDECRRICENPEHKDRCIAFAQDHGAISAKEAEFAKKTGGAGPGGCIGEQCREFCENPENHQACMEFARKHGFIESENNMPPPPLPNGREEFEMRPERQSKPHDEPERRGPGGCSSEEECMKRFEEERGRTNEQRPRPEFRQPSEFHPPTDSRPPEDSRPPSDFKPPSDFQPSSDLKSPSDFRPPTDFQAPPPGQNFPDQPPPSL